jgi:hypothetical protein
MTHAGIAVRGVPLNEFCLEVLLCCRLCCQGGEMLNDLRPFGVLMSRTEYRALG